MKKLLLLCMASLFILGIIGCGNEETKTKQELPVPVAQDNTTEPQENKDNIVREKAKGKTINLNYSEKDLKQDAENPSIYYTPDGIKLRKSFNLYSLEKDGTKVNLTDKTHLKGKGL